VIRLKKVFAVVALVLGITGTSLAVAPPASSLPVFVGAIIDGDPPNDDGLCIRINITLFGNPIGTGPEFTCIP
jgi:hypothetical protein